VGGGVGGGGGGGWGGEGGEEVGWGWGGGGKGGGEGKGGIVLPGGICRPQRWAHRTEPRITQLWISSVQKLTMNPDRPPRNLLTLFSLLRSLCYSLLVVGLAVTFGSGCRDSWVRKPSHLREQIFKGDEQILKLKLDLLGGRGGKIDNKVKKN